MEKLKPDEKELIGNWVHLGNSVIGDATCERIEFLAKNYLEEIGFSEYGAWETLYRDPHDNRYWERVYPRGEMHGGGPPALINLSEKTARSKYSHLFG